MEKSLEEELLHTAEMVAVENTANAIFQLGDESWGHIKTVTGKYYDEFDVDDIDHAIVLLCWCAIVKPEDLQ